jgi:hypothetical protein
MFGIDDALFGSLAGPVLGGLLGGAAGGSAQGGTQTNTRDPWAPAAPWLTQNLQRGQQLQSHYEQNPFNAIQQASYANLLGGNDYINQMTPGLMSQFSRQTGFDRSNPLQRPQGYQFPQMQAMGQAGGMQPTAGLLGGSMGQATAQAPAPAQAAPQQMDADTIRRLLMTYSSSEV